MPLNSKLLLNINPWVYLKDINTNTIVKVSNVSTTRVKGGLQLDILDNWLKNCMKHYAPLCNYLIILLNFGPGDNSQVVYVEPLNITIEYI